MKEHSGNHTGGQGSRQQAEVIADLCYRFVRPLLYRLNAMMDRRLVQTFLDLLQVIVMHRHRNQGLLLSELGGILLGAGHAPAGTKRISNLLHSAGWSSKVVEDYLWQQADQAIDRRLHPQDDVYVIWDESVIEKPESLKAERLCAVRSSKARRLKRIKPGYYNPPSGRPVFVPGLNWLQIVITGLRGAPVLAHLHFWTTRGEAKTTKREEEHRLLRDLAQRWGRTVIHIWDRGFAGAPWLGLAFLYRVRFVVRWNKNYKLIDPIGRLLKAWECSRGKRSLDHRMIYDTRRRCQRKTGIVFLHVQVPGLPDFPLTLVVSRPGKGRKPWYLLTNETVSSVADAWRIVLAYNRRWQVEIVCTQMTKARGFPLGAGWDDKTDFNIFVVHDHSIDKQFYQMSALVKIQTFQGRLDTLTKLLDVFRQCEGLNLFVGLLVQQSQLLPETILGLRQFLALTLKFVTQDDFGQINLQEAFLLALQACQGLADRIALCLQGLRQPFSGLRTFQFMGDQAGIGYEATEILPDEFVEGTGWHIAGGATFTFCGSQSIGASSANVVVILPLGTACGCQTTLSATDQTPEKVFVALIIATCHLFVCLQASLRSIECFLADDGWDRDCDPLFLRGWLDAFTSSHRQQGRFALSCGGWTGASAVGHPCICRRTQNTANSCHIPAYPASRCRNLLFTQSFGNPVKRCRRFWISVPGKDLLNNVGFDWINAHPAGVTGPLWVQDISIRRSRPGQQCPGAQFCLPSTSHPLGDQAALILSHRPTNLQQELIMRIIIFHRAIQFLDRTTQLVQFFYQQNLMNVFASQAIRHSDQNQLEGRHAGGVSQPIQARTIELRACIPIVAINVLLRQLPIGMLGYGFPQTFNLLFNTLTLHLTVGRYSSIKSYLHFCSPDCFLLGADGPQFVPSSSAEETGRHSPSDAAHRSALRMCDELAILCSYLLLNVFWHLGEGYPKFLFPQSQRTSPPRQLQLAPSCQAEFVICDQTIEMSIRFSKAELAFESPRLVAWEHRAKLLALAALVQAFLFSLLDDLLLPLRDWLLDHWCHRTGKRSRSVAAPLYRLRLALSQLWLAFRPFSLPRLN